MRASVFLVVSVSIAACGGSVVVDGPGTGGSGGGTSTTTTTTSTTTTTTSTTTTTTSTITSTCASHDDCPGGVCLFATGTCTTTCPEGFCSDCGPGMVCDPCGTSSCAKCNDCIAACVPTKPGVTCDDTDPCPPETACHFGTNSCVGVCTPEGCGPSAVCVDCATSSCCGCDDCVALCLPAK